ncbi:hypothetical protein D3C73_905280 [compost metagenome]
MYTVITGSIEYKAAVSTKKVTNKVSVRPFSGTLFQICFMLSVFLSSRIKVSWTNSSVRTNTTSINPPVIKKAFCRPKFSAVNPPIVGPSREPAMFAVDSVPSA